VFLRCFLIFSRSFVFSTFPEQSPFVSIGGSLEILFGFFCWCWFFGFGFFSPVFGFFRFRGAPVRVLVIRFLYLSSGQSSGCSCLAQDGGHSFVFFSEKRSFFFVPECFFFLAAPFSFREVLALKKPLALFLSDSLNVRFLGSQKLQSWIWVVLFVLAVEWLC